MQRRLEFSCQRKSFNVRSEDLDNEGGCLRRMRLFHQMMECNCIRTRIHCATNNSTAQSGTRDRDLAEPRVNRQQRPQLFDSMGSSPTP